jgi:undecaprenyl diphosphate synthase
MKQIPKHIAIIMDGNGRWAKARRLPRTAGHTKGVDATKAIVKHAGEIDLQYLTLYAFSTENWQRPADEVNDLMGLLRFYLKSEAAELHKNNVRLRVIGTRDNLSDEIKAMIQHLEDLTSDNNGLNLTIALDYGSRSEILRAAKQTLIDHAVAMGRDNSHLGICWDDGEIEENFTSNFYTSDLPDPDLLIRTSGEMRISNFLLWQCAYSEFIFHDKYWPDFTTDDFDNCIADYQNRDRRYGAVESVKVT